MVRNLESADQHVSQELFDLASQCPWFKNKRSSNKESNYKKLNIGGKGLGFKERPGFNAKSSHDAKDSNFPFKSSSSSGPQTDRAAALRQAFSNQFKSHFVSSSSETAKTVAHEPVTNNAVTGVKRSDGNEDKKNKKSRWDS